MYGVCEECGRIIEEWREVCYCQLPVTRPPQYDEWNYGGGCRRSLLALLVMVGLVAASFAITWVIGWVTGWWC